MQTTRLRQLTGGQYPSQRCQKVVVYLGLLGSRDARSKYFNLRGRLCRFRWRCKILFAFVTDMAFYVTC